MLEIKNLRNFISIHDLFKHLRKILEPLARHTVYVKLRDADTKRYTINLKVQIPEALDLLQWLHAEGNTRACSATVLFGPFIPVYMGSPPVGEKNPPQLISNALVSLKFTDDEPLVFFGEAGILDLIALCEIYAATMFRLETTQVPFDNSYVRIGNVAQK